MTYELKIGNGKRNIVIFPRKDSDPLDETEWGNLLKGLKSEYTFHVFDIPEYIVQKQMHTLNPLDDMTNIAVNYLLSFNQLSTVIGISLGGMILQQALLKSEFEFSVVLISTLCEQTKKTETIFLTWLDLLKTFGLKAFKVSLMPWIMDKYNLDTVKNTPNEERKVEKEILSIEAILEHNLRKRDVISNRACVLYGTNSRLVGQDEVILYTSHFKRLQINPIYKTGMRVLEENLPDSICVIKRFIEEEIDD